MSLNDLDIKNSNGAKAHLGRAWPDWYPLLKTFRNPAPGKASWQLANTLIPYACLWYLMIRSVQLGYPYWLTLILALPAAAFLVRIFILFHDCVHDSFFISKRLNTFFGYLLGVLVFTAFKDWRFSHLRHHGTCANLDARGFGDIWTLTLKEYTALPKRKQLIYRLYRNPVVLIGVGSFFSFLVGNRFSTRTVGQKERRNVLFTNLLILLMMLIAAWFIGWQTYLLIQVPVLWLAGMAGIWLFYLQHQFPGGYWAHKNEWTPLNAAMEGSSFYRLPGLLAWFSGNIGYHHVHHLNPKIPNYSLKKCYDAVPALQAKKQLTMMDSLSCVRLKLWDEERQELVAFS
ncbi:fatty acid desaturase [Desulfobacula sp.]|uniref:fatty acid desaturase n=1 Tax=Desulfobacula sp. TaxID=2593537 RepID=UPI00262BE17F|nr:fatty acid desaturase [Desulfobacula sp.]